MGLQPYSGTDIRLTIEGSELLCLESLSLREDTSGKESIGADASWASFKQDLQGGTISLNGIDQDAWAQLKALRGQVYQILIEDLLTGTFVLTASGYTTSMERSFTPDGTVSFNAAILLTTPIENIVNRHFLLLEDGDYLLLESGDRIIN